MSDAAGQDHRPLGEQSLGGFVDALAAKTSVPGGGAAAGSALAHAAALGSMVIAFSRGKSRYAAHESLLADADAGLATTRGEALRLADADAEGFEALSGLWPLAPDDPDRIAAWPQAVRAAVSPPRELVRLAGSTVDTLVSLVGRTSPMLRSDLAIAARFAVVAAEAAAWNVEMNLEALAALEDGGTEATSLRSEVPATLAHVARAAERIDAACRAGGREMLD